jgi:hypothetical protein
MESANERGIIFPALQRNLRGSTPLELEAFVTVSSDFCPALGR